MIQRMLNVVRALAQTLTSKLLLSFAKSAQMHNTRILSASKAFTISARKCLLERTQYK